MNAELVKLIIKLNGTDNLKNIDENVDLIDDLGFDSISLVELTVEFENTFCVAIDDGDLDIEKLRKLKFLNSLIPVTRGCDG